MPDDATPDRYQPIFPPTRRPRMHLNVGVMGGPLSPTARPAHAGLVPVLDMCQIVRDIVRGDLPDHDRWKLRELAVRKADELAGFISSGDPIATSLKRMLERADLTEIVAEAAPVVGAALQELSIEPGRGL